MGIVRKMRFIETLREGERISEVYLCRHKQTAMTKAGKPYDSLTLQDKTGTLDAKIWDVSSNGRRDQFSGFSAAECETSKKNGRK